MDDKKLAILNDALNAACRVIQDAYGIDDGGYAESFFEGENKAHFECLFSSYIKFEVDKQEDEEDEEDDEEDDEEEDLDHYSERK